MKDLEADKIPRLYIGGTTISQAKFNQNQDVLKLTGNIKIAKIIIEIVLFNICS